MNSELLFLLLLPIIAFLYAAVGHGGASGYLALMALFSFPTEVMKPTGLLLNLFIAAISFYHYWRSGHFNTKLFLAFALASIPLSFLGGMLEVDTKIYKIILGLFLVFAILKMLNFLPTNKSEIRPVKFLPGLAVGGVIGFFSGLIGIGGGIILSPVILLMKWGRMKEAAAVSALFIWVNSAAGMVGQLTQGVRFDAKIWLYVSAAVVGGYLGGYIGSKRLNNSALQYLLALVLLMACIKLFLI